MIKTINGAAYREMVSYGVQHLDRHCAVVNDLNVFPVPDGDTGTNMLMTMRNGLQAIGQETDSLSQVAHRLANATVFGARGNSGVILSQFFKGISEGLHTVNEADCADLVRALEAGCARAYAAVSKPVEGTILTVMREATAACAARLSELDVIDDVISLFLKEANRSLESTPELLPILKKAGVVDSGGAGLVYLFEGMRKYLNGEEPEQPSTAAAATAAVDFTSFNKDSDFSLGYCTELLLQLTDTGEPFDYAALVSGLSALGESLVTSLELDKVKVHVHTRTPEQILAFCHRFGEFLSLKIENMSVQNAAATQKLLCAENAGEGAFAVVAVAPNAMLQQMLSQMGADVVIHSSEAPASGDFLEAFERLDTKDILVFPNSSNSILSAMQAGSLYKGARVTVLNCRSIPECYAALAILDFEAECIDDVVREVNDTIANTHEVAIVHATKNIRYGKKQVVKNDYFALCHDEISESADSIERVVLATTRSVLAERACDVLTLFYGKNVSEEEASALVETLESANADVEYCLIPTQNPIYDLILLFE